MHFLDASKCSDVYPVCPFLVSCYCKTAMSKSFGHRTTDTQRKRKVRAGKLYFACVSSIK